MNTVGEPNKHGFRLEVLSEYSTDSVRLELFGILLPTLIGNFMTIETEDGTWNSYLKKIQDGSLYLGHTIGSDPDEIRIDYKIPIKYICAVQLDEVLQITDQP